MSGTPRGEDPRLLSAAASVAEGVPVDWDEVSTHADAESLAVVEQLRVLEGVSRMSNPIPDTWGPFTITGEIGQGSYGTVYRAIDANLNLEVALKVIRPRESSPHVDPSRRLNEARMLAQLNHPNVVGVYRAECIGEEVGLSMEFVQGRTLNDLVTLQGPFSAREAMLIGVDVCCALAAVHGARLVHGDIKAQNVMRATGGRTVLMDFGAGYDAKTDRLPGRRFAGTPLYLAPEVFAGETRTAVSDIYSVGVLLYYLTTGSYPLEGHTRSEVGQQHEAHAPRRLLRDVRPDLPDAFIRVVDRAIAERPEDRYETAGKLEAALHRALQIEEPAPMPMARPLPFRLMAIAVGVLLALGLGYGLWNMGRDTDTEAQRAVAAPPLATSPPPSASAADTYRIEAAFYREQDGTDVRLRSGARVAPGDKLFLQVLSSVPTYMYVVNEDDYGEAYLLFPLPGQLLSNPLPPGQRHEIPGVLNGERTSWRVTSAGGREHFLIFASPDPPSPAFDRIFAALPRPTVDRPAQPLPSDLAGMLRGVGGLAKTPVRPGGTGLAAEFGVPLTNAEETARGVWVRQLILENPKQ